MKEDRKRSFLIEPLQEGVVQDLPGVGHVGPHQVHLLLGPGFRLKRLSFLVVGSSSRTKTSESQSNFDSVRDEETVFGLER